MYLNNRWWSTLIFFIYPVLVLSRRICFAIRGNAVYNSSRNVRIKFAGSCRPNARNYRLVRMLHSSTTTTKNWRHLTPAIIDACGNPPAVEDKLLMYRLWAAAAADWVKRNLRAAIRQQSPAAAATLRKNRECYSFFWKAEGFFLNASL